jgi:hypothetical protein
MSAEELDSEKIVVEVMDMCYTDRKDYIGIYEFDFTYIYKNKNHCLQNFWVALANPESDDICKVRGYLKLSVSILNESDPRVELSCKSTDDPSSMCMIPPQVKMEYIQVSIHIFKAEQLPDMDSIFSKDKVERQCNGYVKAKYMGTKVKTKIRDMKSELIIWNETLDIPINYPVVSQKIVMSIWDKDPLRSDIIGSFELDVNEILDKKYENFRWIPIYGAPDKSGLYTEKMNANPEIGSMWKGRILLKVDHKKTDNPKKTSRPILDDALLSQVGALGKKNKWNFDFFLYEANFLPKESSDYSIHILVEEEKYKFSTKKAEKRNIQYNIPGEIKLHTLTSDVKEVPDLFIYLCDKSGEYICFQRLKAETFLNNDDIMVIKLIPDPSVGQIKEFVYSGIVKIRITLRNKDFNIPILKDTKQDGKGKKIETEESEEEDSGGLTTEINKMKQNLIKKPTVQITTYCIVANIYMSRHLVSGDPSGNSDPFVRLRIGDDEKNTAVKNDCINCIWNESLFFENIKMDIENKSTWPVIFLQVMDKDILGTDMLAYGYVWLSDSSYDIDDIGKLTPNWVQLHLPISNKPQGQILCSFHIINSSRKDLIEVAKNLDITPDTELYSFEINVLGIRDIKPLSILPVKKAFINFDLNSINVTGREDNNLKSIKTQPKKGGANPTINTVVKFDIHLPTNEIFMPEMQCVVYDYILSGMLNQMLGIFLIPIKDIIDDNSNKISRDLKITSNKLGLFFLGDKIKPPKQDYTSVNVQNIAVDIVNEGLGGIFKKKHAGSLEMAVVKKENGVKYSTLKEDKGDVSLHIEKDPREIKKGMIVEEKEEKPQKQVDEEKKVDEEKHITLLQSAISSSNQGEMLVWPVYKKFTLPGTKPGSKNFKEFEIEDDTVVPNKENYVSIGFNKYPSDKKKHYRRFFNKPLEETTKELGIKSPFYKLSLRRGKFIDRSEETGIFESMRNEDSKIIKKFKNKCGSDIKKADAEENTNKFFDGKDYGGFKGLIRVVKKDKMNEYEEVVKTIRTKGNSNLLQDFKYLLSYEDLAKRILVEKECIVRVYILKLGDLAKKDIGSESDPYVKLHLGDKIINEEKNYKENMKNCDWCQVYE